MMLISYSKEPRLKDKTQPHLILMQPKKLILPHNLLTLPHNLMKIMQFKGYFPQFNVIFTENSYMINMRNI